MGVVEGEGGMTSKGGWKETVCFFFFFISAQISVLCGLCHIASASMRASAEDQQVGKLIPGSYLHSRLEFGSRLRPRLWRMERRGRRKANSQDQVASTLID